MPALFWLSNTQMAHLEPRFSMCHSTPRDDARRGLSGVIFIKCNGLRWRDALKDYGSHKTLQPLDAVER